MTPDKINRVLISMFSKFTVCVKALVVIVKAHAIYMSVGYDKLADEYASSSCDWLVVRHDNWDSVIKQFFDISMYGIDLQSWMWYKLAFGLAVPDKHNTQTCNDAAMAILKRYNIHCNDTTMHPLQL